LGRDRAGASARGPSADAPHFGSFRRCSACADRRDRRARVCLVEAGRVQPPFHRRVRPP